MHWHGHGRTHRPDQRSDRHGTDPPSPRANAPPSRSPCLIFICNGRRNDKVIAGLGNWWWPRRRRISGGERPSDVTAFNFQLVQNVRRGLINIADLQLNATHPLLFLPSLDRRRSSFRFSGKSRRRRIRKRPFGFLFFNFSWF